MREDAAAKGRRLLTEGRLVVERVDGRRIEATCRGDTAAVYRLGFGREAEWWCECPALGRCSHLVALQLVVAHKARDGGWAPLEDPTPRPPPAARSRGRGVSPP